MLSTGVSDHFSTTYAQAREKFLEAGRAAGAELTSYRHPAKGPSGEGLFCDVARLGPEDARQAILVVSATHGVEGFCGSGVQVGLMRTPEISPDRVALLLIHAINPYGFAWLRRVTEDNVDLNRNFVDHEAGQYPENLGYEQLAEALVPRNWDEESLAASQRVLDAYAAEHGLLGLQTAISSGQYRHSDGVFFGGTRTSWSRRTLERIVTSQLDGVSAAALIDIHTGLGPYAYGEPISVQAPHTSGHARARAWYGEDVTSPEGGTSTSPTVTGDLGSGVERTVSRVQWTGIALEYGTLPISDVLDALRADAWLHARGDLESELGKRIKADIRRAFYPDEPEWKKKVWARAVDMVGRAAAGLEGA
ncbi:MAG: M14 family metallopeptidase [Alphaproteobacteria bacterium]